MKLFNTKFSPMLLHEINKPFDSKEYIFELKFDGIRAIIHINNKTINIYSRNKNKLNDLFPELLNIKNIVDKNVIFDGEIVLMEDGKPSFSSLLKRMRLKNKNIINEESINNPVTFVCFDILYENKDLTNKTLLERKKFLEKYKNNSNFIKTKYFFKNGIKLFNEIKKLNLEGIVAKNIKSKYEINKRSENWIKIKNIKDEDFYICGYIENKKGYMNTLILGNKINNNYYYNGKVTINKNIKDFETIKKQKTISKSPLKDYNNKKITYIPPKLKCSVIYTEKTKNNTLRHAVYKTLK